jgi:hypothetical protein
MLKRWVVRVCRRGRLLGTYVKKQVEDQARMLKRWVVRPVCGRGGLLGTYAEEAGCRARE